MNKIEKENQNIIDTFIAKFGKHLTVMVDHEKITIISSKSSLCDGKNFPNSFMNRKIEFWASH